MSSIFKDVAKFNEACEIPIERPGGNTFRLYQRLFAEELSETAQALDSFDKTVRVADADGGIEVLDHVAHVESLANLADGLIDTIYIAAGWLRAMGLDGQHIWDLVQDANMSKVDPETGLVRKREDGKVLKPEGWVAPDAAIKQHVAKALGYTQRNVKDLDSFIAQKTTALGKVQAAVQQASLVERMFSVEEAAILCGISRTLLMQEVAAGKLRAKVFGKNTLRVPESALAAYQRA